MKSIILLFVLAVLSSRNNGVAVECLGAPKNIDILVVIDTQRLLADFTKLNETIRKDADNPTHINHNYAFMITSHDFLVSGQATANLHIKCTSGDLINWHGVSESNNFDNQVIVYQLKHNNNILREVTLDRQTKEYVFPKNNNIKELEVMKLNTLMIHAICQNADVIYDVHFGVYRIHRETGKRELFGYFKWSTTITNTVN